MIEQFTLDNIGRIEHVAWNNLSGINLLIGENGTGKTTILKALYAVVKSLETTGKGSVPQSLIFLLMEKFRWTFQVADLANLIHQNANETVSLECALINLQIDGESLEVQIHKPSGHGKIADELSCIGYDDEHQRKGISVYISPKEVFSLHSVIRKSREQDMVFGFDDTYLDLVRLLQNPLRVSSNTGDALQAGSSKISAIMGGHMEYDEQRATWLLVAEKLRLPIELASEGTKKLATIERLLMNGTLGENSILFIDEPEASLHPRAISAMMDILYELVQYGIQIFMATQSYFVIKKLALIAKKEKYSIPLLSLNKNFKEENVSVEYSDLQDGMPDNSIIAESIALYEDEFDVIFDG